MKYVLESPKSLKSIGVAFALTVVALGLFAFRKRRKSKLIRCLNIVTIIASVGLSINAYHVTSNEVAHMRFIEEKEKYYSEYERTLDIPNKVEYGSEVKITFGSDFDDELELNTSELGKHKYKHEVIDEDDYKHTFEFEVEVIDTTPPEIFGDFDYNVPVEKGFNKKDINVKAVDNVDGDVDVEIKGDLDGNKEGTYNLQAVASDKSGNVSKKDITVKVYEQPNQTIKFPNGRIIHYYNKGQSSGQYQIDSQPHTATTWNMASYVQTHNNKDGKPTYFAGHNYNAFTYVTKMGVGEIVSVRDHTGNITKYETTARYHIDVTPSGNVVHPSRNSWNRLTSFTGEGIVFQTCVSGNPYKMIIVEARPI